MKKFNFYLLMGVMSLSLFACKKNTDDVVDSTSDYPKPPADYVKSSHLSGIIKGTLKEDSTYTLDGSIVVNPNDTLAVQAGAKIIVKGNYNIVISGTLLCLGTNDKPITFTSQDGTEMADLGVTGHWGGFLVDSVSKYVYVRFTHINFTGGPDSEGNAQASFDVEGSQTYNNSAHIVFEDNWMFGGIDDGIHLAGDITVSIKRNVLQRLGGPDGETMNVKKGVKGDIAYNYIWSAANSGIKLETSKTVFSPQTNMNIFNNTIVNSGWRKVGEATNAILIDKYASANIFNNVLVGNHTGINIAEGADTMHCTYGNNLIYAIDDSLKNWVYAVGSVGKIKATDVIGSGHTACSSVFTNWDPGVTPELTMQDNTIPSLKTGSPTIGKGAVVAPFTYWITTSGNNGTADMVNTDMGAYPMDGSGNKHLPTKKPAL